MGCSGSKTEDLPLVVHCRERRELIHAAANHRYTLAAAHVSYFRSLKDVGDALRKFVDEELITYTRSSSSSSPVSSPSLILPPNSKKKIEDDSDDAHLHDEDDSHLQISGSSDDDDDGDNDFEPTRHKQRGSLSKHKENGSTYGEASHSNEGINPEYPRWNFSGYGFEGGMQYPYAEPYTDQYNWGGPELNPWNYYSYSNVNYMKKHVSKMKTVVQEPPAAPSSGYSDSFWSIPAVYSGNYGYFPTSSPGRLRNDSAKVSRPEETPPPPPPLASGWDFLNPFDGYDNGYPSYYSTGVYGRMSNSSSPDSNEVREREGIPDLEEETETEVYKEVLREKKASKAKKRSGQRTSTSKGMNNAESRKKSGESSPRSRTATSRKNSEGSLRSVPLGKSENSSASVPLHKSEGSSRSVPSWTSEETEKRSMPSQDSDRSAKPSISPLHSKGKSRLDQSPSSGTSGSVNLADEKSSTDTTVSKSLDEDSVRRRKGVTFEVEEMSKQTDSSKMSSFTTLSPHATRDLRDAVGEIRDEFEIASGCGKEVAVILEVGKMPFQPGLLRVILSRILQLLAPSLSSQELISRKSAKLASRSVKLANSYFEDVGKDVNVNACNLSSTLDKLCAWEKKLYKEVKEEERLRLIYEKQCKRLKLLDENGAEPTKIYASQDSIRRLQSKLDVSIKAIDAVSTRIQKLRDEELKPQIAELIMGLVRMWKAMLKCHRKQFQAIMESKMRKLKANTGFQTDSSSTATADLERELHSWCRHFKDWIFFQKSYVESLNGWLLQSLQYEPEETPDGPMPYSPGRLEAPPIFIICHDWHQAMATITEAKVANTMNAFATALHQLSEKQDEEMRQRIIAESLMKEYREILKTTQHMDKGKLNGDPDVMSDKTGLSVVPSDSGVLPLGDIKVDLETMRQKLAEERIKHKDAMKLLHDAASSGLQGGLVPIFRSLDNFTSEALTAHEHVRLRRQ